ncbi:A24 family peptidase [uncultured Limosilactobacillus sp.]|uniref:prepilin peptidase n=1 Tax=uncultured Limosilactobacillus sp. TaxID=2837629 RepID=UPI0025FC21D7|nr:A24 family peptidase [uncultured Limosilactobacillus sp.]
MLLLYQLLLFVAGSCYASLLITVGQRWAGLSCFGTRSQCPVCTHKGGWWQLIPLLGWMLQRGRCHDCHSPIGALSTICEFLCGTCLAIAAHLSLTSLLCILITATCLLLMTATDWQAQWIHPAFIAGLLPLTHFFCPASDQLSVIVTGGMAILVCLAVLASYLGVGDAEFIIVLFAVVGPFDGAMILLVACLSLLFATLVTNQQKHPFIPWLSLGIAMVWLVNWGILN